MARPQAMTMRPQRTIPNHEHVRRASTEELARTIARCEDAIADGSAEIEDYEAFVLCQKELARRTWS